MAGTGVGIAATSGTFTTGGADASGCAGAFCIEGASGFTDAGTTVFNSAGNCAGLSSSGFGTELRTGLAGFGGVGIAAIGALFTGGGTVAAG
ncbi:MAG: hypothetical protein WAN32_11490, partial [Candidatus Acidiferrum sp.]